MPVPSPAAPANPSPAHEGGEGLAAGRARGPPSESSNPPETIEDTGVSDAVKGMLRRASPCIDRALNARNAAGPRPCLRGPTDRSSSVPHEMT